MQEADSNYSQLSKRRQNTFKIEKGKILCNYFPLKITKQIQNIYVFNIEMSPHIPFEKLALRTRILSMLQLQMNRYINKPIITGLQIYSHTEPKVTEKMFQSGEYRIFVKLSKIVRVKQNPNLFVFIMEGIIRNLMIKKCYNQLCKARKYFDMKKKVQHYAVNVYSGYHVDFVKSQTLFYLRIDSARKIVCSQTALDAIDYCYKICRQRDREERRRFIKQKMIGRTVMANYGRNRFYKIKDIAFQSVEFERMDDKPLMEYFQQKYGIQVKNLSQPLLVISNKKLEKQNKTCYLVPQLCFMVGLPQDIEEVKQRNILAAIKLQPEQIRVESAVLMQDILQEVDEWKSLEKLGVILQNKQMPLIDCKKFPKPILELGSNLKVQRGLETLFNIACRPIYQGNHPIKCGILYFNRADINYLSAIFQKNSKDIGIQIQFAKVDMGQLNNNKALTQVQMAIIRACQQFKTNIVLIVLPNGLKSYYRKIKKFCLIDHKILSQIVCQSMLPHRHSVTIFGKILLQIIAKCGNILWIPKQCIQTQKKIMFLAYQTGKAGTQIVVSTCCTVDQSYYVGYSKFAFANQNSQRSTQLLQVMIKNGIECLEYYIQKNGKLPDQVIFISKAGSISVSENILKQKFVIHLKKQIKSYYESKKFCITYILIETKDSSKFFIYQNPHSKARNAQTGTVVDEAIVKNNQFLLITQATPGVSATPIRFKIILTDSQLQRTILQQLLFNQCFCYANFTGLVQVPAILQYAKKLAQFVSQAPFEQALDRKIQQIPYYL